MTAIIPSAVAALIVFALGFNFAMQGGDSRMGAAWYPVIAVVGVQLLGVSAIWGALHTKVQEHDRRIGILETARTDTAALCRQHAERLSKVEGEMGVEG